MCGAIRTKDSAIFAFNRTGNHITMINHLCINVEAFSSICYQRRKPWNIVIRFFFVVSFVVIDAFIAIPDSHYSIERNEIGYASSGSPYSGEYQNSSSSRP